MGIINELQKLFAGLKRAHGRYELSGETTASGKAKGKARTIKEPVTEMLWKKHLNGEQGLGIVPIRDDSTCFFGVIDIDSYDVDLIELEQRIRELNFPLLLLRSKSGGGHAYLFTIEPVPAELIRRQLGEMAVALNFPGVEIFPKQTQLANEQDTGNWINMPYFDANRTTRYCIKEGRALSLEEFITYANEMRITQAQLEEIEFPQQIAFEDGPPCLQYLASVGFPEGSRNNALFDCGVYARKRYGDNDFPRYVQEYNVKYMGPGAPSEVQQIIRSLNKKSYMYMCDQPPINAHCNRDICRQRKYGIGADSSDPGVIIEAMSKINTDPPTFFITVNGVRIMMTSDHLTNQSLFGKKVFEALLFLPTKIKHNDWSILINRIAADAEIIEAPVDASLEGQFRYHVEQFCLESPARHKDELLQGKAWKEDGRIYLRAVFLKRYLDSQRFKMDRDADLYVLLRNTFHDVDHKRFNIKGSTIQTWSIPEFEMQDEEYSIPRLPEQEF